MHDGKHIQNMQEKLNRLGFNCGNADGIFGPKTRLSVMDFQAEYFVDGTLDKKTIDAIGVADGSWSDKSKEIYLKVPRGLDEIVECFGDIEYRNISKRGYFVVENNWVHENIVEEDLGFVGVHYCHRIMVPIFTQVFKELVDRGLDSKVKEFAGIWSPRHKMHNPKRDLSTHAWAIACDINPSTNMPGTVGDMDPGIVETFEKFGFTWGGRWRNRDDMHFQYCTGY